MLLKYDHWRVKLADQFFWMLWNNKKKSVCVQSVIEFFTYFLGLLGGQRRGNLRQGTWGHISILPTANGVGNVTLGSPQESHFWGPVETRIWYLASTPAACKTTQNRAGILEGVRQNMAVLQCLQCRKRPPLRTAFVVWLEIIPLNVILMMYNI